jgi:CheY-like chemotaxis protein
MADLANLRVLVVDDSREICRIVSTVLQPVVKELRTCEEPNLALKIYRDWRPDLVIVDFEMGAMTGADFTKRLRNLEAKVGRRTAVLMMTAHTDKRRVLEARDAGVDDLVVKPITVGALTRKMLSACGRAAGPRQAIA